jgi:hypothetical protein
MGCFLEAAGPVPERRATGQYIGNKKNHFSCSVADPDSFLADPGHEFLGSKKTVPVWIHFRLLLLINF